MSGSKDSDFCRYCGANIPPIYGEGTCPKCDPIGVLENVCKFPECGCEVPFWAFSKEKRIDFCIKLKDDPCIKEGMNIDTCRYSNLLGCDCGYHKPNPTVARSSTYQR